MIIRQNGEKLIVNWQGFSVANGERTQFVQPGSTSSALNRVIGGARSIIDGRLEANGTVILINPAGLTVGPNGVVNVNSFIGTTLDITDENYLAGSALDLSGNSEADVTNLGTVRAATGDVHLIAKHVVNNGTLEAPNGAATLTAATEVRIQPDGDQKIFIKPNSQKGGTVVNKGTIRAAAAEVQAAGNPYALAINLEGIIDVKGTAAKPAGRVKIAGGGGNVAVAGTMKARKADRSGGRIAINESETAPGIVNVSGMLDVLGEGAAGGELLLVAENLLIDGTLDASGTQGGGINLAAKRASNSGTITAEGTVAAGGTIRILTKEAYLDTVTSKLVARGATNGGSIVVNASGDGARIYSSSTMDVSGTSAVGGSIVVTSAELYLMASQLNANGASGGGQILVGGDYQGKNPAIQNAKTLHVSPESKFTANALRTGNGGKVVAWSDGTTTFFGTSEARGGSLSGNGGFIEVSGKEKTTFGGFATAAAPKGQAGSFLLDPKNIVIGPGSGTLVPSLQFEFIDPHKAAGNGFGFFTVALTTGNVVITAPFDDLGGSDAGAVYLFNGTTGALISALRGSSADNQIGSSGVQALGNGNFVVRSSMWDNGGTSNAGAVTWGNGRTGINGTVNASNSLVGTSSQEWLGSSEVIILGNGNYVVTNNRWSGTRGAVTWGNGTTGISGTISDNNSLVGTTYGDRVGVGGSITVLSNGNYVVVTSGWDNDGLVDAGAVTWGTGATGIRGTISAGNSLVGSSARDYVGSGGVTALSNGNYVVASPQWDNGGLTNVGAVTWGDGATGIRGTISAGNSLVGSSVNASVGSSGVAALSNGNYVVSSPSWGGGRGAVTWANGTTGLIGTVSELNSLVGENAGDVVGNRGVAPLSNGNYVVVSAYWNDYRGAVTWGNGVGGSVGTVSAQNSLVGSKQNDFGNIGITALTNGNYVVSNSSWNNERGAVTWANGTGGTVGVVSSVNSLVGSREGDYVGENITVLTNGNYLVSSSAWNDTRGAATWGSGTGGTIGIVSGANSLVGSNPGDFVSARGITALTNGNYVVNSWDWNDYRGAVTWGNGTKGITGSISDNNSLVGGKPYDQVGGSGVTALPNGNYVVASYGWDNGSIVDAGAATFGNGATGVKGVVSLANSQVGGSANSGLAPVEVDLVNHTYLTRFTGDTSSGSGGRVYANSIWGPSAAGIAYSMNPSTNVTLTAASITAITNTGTKVFLQANNDITVNEAIVSSNPSGNGGALILSAGRSIFVKANLTTDNGDLTLIANELLSNGVIDAYRDAGAAVIAMAPSAVIDAGSGAVTIELRNGAGKTYRQSGAISVGDVTAGRISAINRGSTNGSNIALTGTLTASGGGNAIVLAGKQFINYSGSAALSAANGRWLVYANTVEGNVFGGLRSGHQAIYHQAAGTKVSAGGNRYVFAERPLLTFTTTNAIKNVGDDLTATVVNQFTVTGWVNAALYGDVFTQDTLANTTLGQAVAFSNGAMASATAFDSPYSVMMDFADLTVLNGYAFGQIATGVITVNPLEGANSSGEMTNLAQLTANLLFDQSAQPFSQDEEDSSGEDSESEAKEFSNLDGFEIHFEGGTIGGMPAFLVHDSGN